MKYKPLVSIIIPVYNGSNFMKEAIDSALAQTYDNIEVIVVNDGSIDNGESEAIALSYRNKITYYPKRNGGVSSALNYALERVHGEWFSWLSHDDLYYSKKIEKQIAFINQLIEGEPNLDLNKIVVHCATESINYTGKIIKKPNYSDLKVKERTIDTIIGNVYNYRLSGCSFLLPVACYQSDGGFREDIRTVSDVEYWYRLLFAGYQFYCMKNDILVKNRSHDRQIGKTKVLLFEQELNSLHINIGEKLNKDKSLGSDKNLISYYYGLAKRHIKEAKKHVKTHILKNRVSIAKYYFLIPVIEIWWMIQGSFRNLVKAIYRKIFVK